MRRLHEFWARLRCMFRRDRLERDLQDEVAFHLAMAAEDGCADPARRFGNAARICEDTRERWRFAWLEATLADLRYSARSLARSPSFTVAAVLVLALGIGGNAAILSALEALLVRPLPGVHEPHRLIAIGRTEAGTGFDTLSFPDVREIESGTSELDGVAVWRSEPVALEADGGMAGAVTAHAVSRNYFEVLRPDLLLGRGASSQGETVLGHALWKSALAGDRAVIGRKVSLNGTPVVVTGVAARDFSGANCGTRPDLWIAVEESGEAAANRALHSLSVIARLRPGGTVVAARQQLNGIAARISREFPGASDFGLALNDSPGLDPPARAQLHTYFQLLGGVTLLVLIAACANVGNLLLARGAARHREIATRLAIGASRSRIVRQLVTESLLLAAVAAVAGIALAYGAAAWMSHRPGLPPAIAAIDFRPDLRVVGIAIALSLITGLGFGVGPALASTRGATRRERGRMRVREWLIAGQIGVSLALVIAAGLLIRSLANAQGIRLGFETGGVWLADCKLSAPDTGIQERIAGELRAAFGNTSVSAIQVLPLQGRAMDGPVEINGRTVLARFNGVGDGHFTLLRIPLRLGREFTWRDGAHSLPVAVVNEAFSRAYGASLGKTLRAFPDNQAREIVGVVADHVYSNLRETVRPAIYRPLAQVPAAQFSWEIRGPGTASFGVRLAEVLRGAPAGAAMGRVRPLEQLFRDELWQSRVTTGFVAAFAGLALLLAAVGLYGIVAYSVTQRRREMGVRVALGARPAEVAGLFLRRVAVLICAGTVAGNLLAMGAAGLLRSQLYGVGATDPWTIAGADVVLAMVAAAAVVVPTARAVAVDAAEVLRED